MKELPWSSETPVDPGHYWFRGNTDVISGYKPTTYEIQIHTTKSEQQPLVAYVYGHSEEFTLDKFTGMWCKIITV